MQQGQIQEIETDLEMFSGIRLKSRPNPVIPSLSSCTKSLIISNEDWQLGAFELRGKLSTEE